MSCPPVNKGWTMLAARLQTEATELNKPPGVNACCVNVPTKSILEVEIGSGDANGGAGRMQLGLRGADLRPVMDEVRRQAGGNFARQSKVIQGELGRRPPDQDRKRMVGGARLLPKGRQQGSIACKLALCGQQLRSGVGAELDRRLRQIDVAIVTGVVAATPHVSR